MANLLYWYACEPLALPNPVKLTYRRWLRLVENFDATACDVYHDVSLDHPDHSGCFHIKDGFVQKLSMMNYVQASFRGSLKPLHCCSCCISGVTLWFVQQSCRMYLNKTLIQALVSGVVSPLPVQRSVYQVPIQWNERCSGDSAWSILGKVPSRQALRSQGLSLTTSFKRRLSWGSFIWMILPIGSMYGLCTYICIHLPQKRTKM